MAARRQHGDQAAHRGAGRKAIPGGVLNRAGANGEAVSALVFTSTVLDQARDVDSLSPVLLQWAAMKGERGEQFGTKSNGRRRWCPRHSGGASWVLCRLGHPSLRRKLRSGFFSSRRRCRT